MNIDAIRRVTTLVTHANCPDGTASAILVVDALNDVLDDDVRVVFAQHGTAEYEALPAEPGMLFVDMTPPRARAREFVDAGAIVLDHHVGQRDVVEAFGERGVYEDRPGRSGAMLAYEHVWRPITESSRGFGNYTERYEEQCKNALGFATLAGIRDTWQRSDRLWELACEQAEILRFYTWERWRAEEVTGAFFDEPIDFTIGRVLMERKRSAVESILKEANRFHGTAWVLGGLRQLRVVAFNSVALTSDAAEALGDEADLVVGFHYASPGNSSRIIFSLRSHSGFDCAALAKRFGGGGHKAAAGFSINPDDLEEDADRDPYSIVWDVVNHPGLGTVLARHRSSKR